ncbi:DUF2599 domain-containing protein [Nocardia cyriacigeorgica]|uniref:DUF2599 domain-containing protein n=1 Tax=Nocardia cyriacigeorgica TaxID=135487 RepID=UPI001892F328|nr:DUF2599 domain-containing protein [Nocardia cyriacigeorgica]MBF6089693.1 DUF2599 domain-containing protein [Nocardia cyriacigeorgica]MBF6094828.1 DUF2599 domain-containing protein [Nocardia cyriacigeorgica]MBF6098531.1 DUF2599 domain-containing protein [Nocardia cyriacigeorgica]MBF6160689.1 DUF2599 domain-containing protein [Nocardia cyriacigeorgica]MBF6199544.1 DUF2599 domain-containing protein [Nocardia cyriacigeorgica]
MGRPTAGAVCALLIPAALALSGCGSDDSPAARSAATTTAARTTAVPTPAAPATTTGPAASAPLGAPAETPLASAPTIDPYAGQPLIDNVVWTENIDGPRLLVHPTPAGRRTTFPGSEERAWQEVLAQSPEAGSPGMRDQFICHWDWARIVAPDKPSWNLEPWRPDVGYLATVEARCNPGGPER